MLIPGTKVSSIKILHTVTIKMIHFCAFSEARSPNTCNFCPLFTRTLNMHLNYKCTTRPPYSKSKCPQQLKSCKYSRNRKHIRILPSSYYSKVVYFFFQTCHKKKRLQKQKSVVGNAQELKSEDSGVKEGTTGVIQGCCSSAEGRKKLKTSNRGKMRYREN